MCITVTFKLNVNLNLMITFLVSRFYTYTIPLNSIFHAPSSPKSLPSPPLPWFPPFFKCIHRMYFVNSLCGFGTQTQGVLILLFYPSPFLLALSFHPSPLRKLCPLPPKICLLFLLFIFISGFSHSRNDLIFTLVCLVHFIKIMVSSCICFLHMTEA